VAPYDGYGDPGMLAIAPSFVWSLLPCTVSSRIICIEAASDFPFKKLFEDSGWHMEHHVYECRPDPPML